MRTNDIGKGKEQVEMKRMRYRCKNFGFGVPCGAYNGKSTIKKKAHGAWLALHKARLMLTIPFHTLQSVADKEKTEYLFLSLKGLSELPFFFICIWRAEWMLQKITENYKIKSA